MPPDDEMVEERHLQVLLADYAEARDDERTFTNSTGVAFTLLLAVLGGLAGLASSDTGSRLLADHDNDLLKVLVPAAPLAILIYLQLQATTTIVRSYYMRSLEAEIASLDRSAGDLGSLAASYTQVLLTITSLRRGNVRYRVLALIVLVIVVVVFGGMVVFLAFTVRWPYAIAIALLYTPPVALLARENYSVTIRGNHMWFELMEDWSHFPIPGLRPYSRQSRDGRSLLSYLLLPRLEELVKLSFITAGFLVGSLFLGAVDGRSFGAFLLALAVFEYLVYEARYQWNDLRGAQADRTHTEVGQRGRLTVGSTDADLLKAVRASAGVALVRLAAALVICIALLIGAPSWRATAWLVLLASVAALAVAAVYEALRERDASSQAIWVVVGFGYAIRVTLGTLLPASMAAGMSPEWALTGVVAAATGWAIGSTSILMTWALEASAAVMVPARRITGVEPPEGTAAADTRPRTDLGDAALVPDAEPPVALVLTASARRVHIRDLAPSTDVLLGALPVPVSEPLDGYRTLGAFPVLQYARRDTPWNRRASAAAGATAAIGVWAAVSWGTPGNGPATDAFTIAVTLFAGLGAAAAAWWVVGFRSSPTRWAGWGGVTAGVAMVTVLDVDLLASISLGRSMVVGLLAVVPLCYFHVFNYTLFRDASYHGLKHPFRPFTETVTRFSTTARRRVWTAVVGRALAAQLMGDPAAHPDEPPR